MCSPTSLERTALMRKADATLTDIHARITNKIIAALEAGTPPWRQPWNAAPASGAIIRPLRHGGEPYNGINVVMLWSAATDAGYASPYWLTFKQALECGGNVRKGEKGELVVYANRMTRKTTNDEGDEVELTIPFLKGYVVFNAAQCENLPPHFMAPAGKTVAPLMDRCEAVDRFFAATRATIRHGGNRAYYAEKPDYIQMPPFESFHGRESYAATLAHEGIHWTKHESRRPGLWAQAMGR
jgi:antirestriction protein ArdC